MPAKQNLHEYTFDELAAEMAQRVHSDLLENGGKGLKSGVFNAMQAAILWRKECDAQEAEKRAAEKRARQSFPEGAKAADRAAKAGKKS